MILVIIILSYHYLLADIFCVWFDSSICQPNPGLPSTNHRRVACSFRDQSLYQIFQISLTSLKLLKNDGRMISFVATTLFWCLQLFVACLTSLFWCFLFNDCYRDGFKLHNLQLLVDCKSWHSRFLLNVYLLTLLGHLLMRVLRSLALFRYLLYISAGICFLLY